MDARADYAVARSALANAHLPPYISCDVRSHAGFAAIKIDETTTLVVRTGDARIVGGTPPHVRIGAAGVVKTVGTGATSLSTNVLADRPFRPECYRATGPTLARFDAQPAEAVTRQGTCRGQSGHGETDFTLLYADPVTHRPIAVGGDRIERDVTAHIEERFAETGGFVMPAGFSVKIEGSGLMFWLNVDARQRYTNDRFLDELPPGTPAHTDAKT